MPDPLRPRTLRRSSVFALTILASFLVAASGQAVCVDNDADGSPVGDTCPNGTQFDCDDNDPSRFPGNAEICDGIDNDCDFAVINEFDDDGDGVLTCAGDCDDNDPNRYPGNLEICDGIDNDCDFVTVDEFDNDLDGVRICGGDCDDNDPNRFPGNAEICDGIDNDCDFVTINEFDNDLDGVLTCDGDCNDNDPNASIVEDWYPDCDSDGTYDLAATNACGESGANVSFACNDGLAPDGGWTTTPGSDCNDEDPTGSSFENWYPDCDGDGAYDSNVTNACGVSEANAAYTCGDGLDPDGGWGTTPGTDCNDEDPTGSFFQDWYPDCDDDGTYDTLATNACGESGAAAGFDCNDGLDPDGGWSVVPGSDCNDEDATGSAPQNWYPDCDSDGVYDTFATNACGETGADAAFDCNDGLDPDGGWSTSQGGDCNDEDPTGSFFQDWYPDCDSDGAYDTIPTNGCGESEANLFFDCNDGLDPDGGWSTLQGGDCNDEDPTSYPGAVEVCDGVDNNCDFVIDEAPLCSAPQVPVLPPFGLGALGGLIGLIGALSLVWVRNGQRSR